MAGQSLAVADRIVSSEKLGFVCMKGSTYRSTTPPRRYSTTPLLLALFPRSAASSHPLQKPLESLAGSPPNLATNGVDHRETPASIHQPGADNLHPWFLEFQSPPRNECHVKWSSTEPSIGQKPLPLPLPSQSDCVGL